MFLFFTSSLSGNQLIGCFCWWSYRNQPFVSYCVLCVPSINNHISCMESLWSLWWKQGDISSLWALPFQQIYPSQTSIRSGWASIWIIREALNGCKHHRVTIMRHGKVSTKGVSWPLTITSCAGGNMEDYWSRVTCLCWVQHVQCCYRLAQPFVLVVRLAFVGNCLFFLARET